MSPNKFSEVTRLYCDAEKKIKKVEHLSVDVAIPAINQLRYAGRHLIRVVGGLSKNPAEDLEQAENHCKRSCYDAGEAGLLYCLDNFRKLQEDYSTTPISKFFPGYVEACHTNDDAREFVDINSDGSREELFQAIDTHLNNLIAIDKKLPHIRDEINKYLVEERKNYVRNLIYFIVTLITMIAAILAIPAFNH